VIDCALEVIRVRRTLVWCYLDVCTAIELIVLCVGLSSKGVVTSEILCLPVDIDFYCIVMRRSVLRASSVLLRELALSMSGGL